MGFGRGASLVLLVYGYLNICFIRMGSECIVTRAGPLGDLTGISIILSVLVIILGVIDCIMHSNEHSLKEKVKPLRSSLISFVIPIQVMVGCCYISKLLHNLEDLRKIRCPIETTVSVATALCQYALPIMALTCEIPGTSIRRSNIHIAAFILFGTGVCLYFSRTKECICMYPICSFLDRMGLLGKILACSKVVIVPLIAYEALLRLTKQKAASPSKEKIKKS